MPCAGPRPCHLEPAFLRLDPERGERLLSEAEGRLVNAAGYPVASVPEGGRARMDDFVERKIGDLTVRVDRLRCISSSNCMEIAPDLFEYDAEKICAFKENPGAVERERLIEACDICPVDALSVFDANRKQLVP
jgi:ferredoxin